MKLDEILQKAGKKKARKRVGRGQGSQGKTAGRGHKGYGSRAGAKANLGFEGGQNPVIARMPKRGFNNANFRTEYQVVNVAALDARFDDGAMVDPTVLAAANLIADAAKPVKILGTGELGKKLNVTATKFSESAAKKIEEAGGSVERA